VLPTSDAVFSRAITNHRFFSSTSIVFSGVIR
jgi:hypothetical protein